MIVITTLKDEIVNGQRKFSGKKFRHRIVLAVDKFNIELAISKGDNPLTGQKFCSRLVQFRKILLELGLDEESCLKAIQKSFSKFLGESLESLSWSEIDSRLDISKRRVGSGELLLYERLKKSNWNETS